MTEDALYELALFAGAGGGLLGGKLLGWQCIGAVERDDYCRRVLLQHQRDGIFAPFPIWDDMRTFTEDNDDVRPFIEGLRRVADRLVITAGFPCQPFSNAGKRLGADDPRNGWPWTIRSIREIRPRYALLENVPGLLTSGYFDTILSDLAACGYDANWRVLSAVELGAPHQRDRLWIIAYPSGTRSGVDSGRNRGSCRQEWSSADALESEILRQEYGADCTERIASGCGDVADTQRSRRDGWAGAQRAAGRPESANGCEFIPDAERPRLAQRQGQAGKRPQSTIAGGDWWAVEPRLGRVANGVARRVDRLKAIGNGQVPAVVRAAWHLLKPGE